MVGKHKKILMQQHQETNKTFFYHYSIKGGDLSLKIDALKQIQGGGFMKSIVRIKKETNFVVMDKTFLHDTSLSWKAKGIMAYMLSKPDNWTFYIEELIKNSTDGKASFRSGFKELQDQGYVKRYPIRKNNKIDRWETVVLENPLFTDFQEVGNQVVEKQEVGNQPLLNNDSTKNDSTKNDNKYIVEIINYLNDVANKNYR